jgi:hypothetical protein
MSDQELGRKLTLLLDDLDQERQFLKAATKDSKDRQELLIRRVLDVRNEIKFGQKTLFTNSADQGKSPAAGRAAAETAEQPLPSHNPITEALDDARPDELNA